MPGTQGTVVSRQLGTAGSRCGAQRDRGPSPEEGLTPERAAPTLRCWGRGEGCIIQNNPEEGRKGEEGQPVSEPTAGRAAEPQQPTWRRHVLGGGSVLFTLINAVFESVGAEGLFNKWCWVHRVFILKSRTPNTDVPETR